jgi:6-phosphogluconolactonase
MCHWSIPLTVSVVALLAADTLSAADSNGKLSVFVGTYTGPKTGSRGIYRCEFDPATGDLSPPRLIAEVVNPSFLAIHPSGKYLFAVGEFDGPRAKAAGVTSFLIDAASGMLSPVSQRPSGGKGPCHVAIDKAGHNLIVSNYGSGSVALLKVDQNGGLNGPADIIQHHGKGPDPKRQEGPHAHSANLDAANRFAVVADLGLDRLFVYRFDGSTDRLTPNDPPSYQTAPGAGPRHFAFHPDGKRAFVINELNSTLSALDYDADRGVLRQRQTVSTLPLGFSGTNWCAEVVVHPSGKFVYGSNRGHNSIAAFAIEADGKLRPIGHQGEGVKTPRNFNIDPSGRWMIVANQDGNDLVVFRIDTESGALSSTGRRVEIGGPVCVMFWPVK